MNVRKIMLLFTGMLLLIGLSACNKSGKEYVEKTLELPEGITYASDIVKMEDGKLEIAGINREDSVIGIWESEDNGSSWKKIQDLGEFLKGKENVEDVRVELTEQGEGMLIIQTQELPYFYYFDLAGTVRKIENSNAWKIRENEIVELGYVSGSTLFCRTQDEKYLLCDMTSGDAAELDLAKKRVLSYCAEGEDLYVLTEKGILCFDKQAKPKELEHDAVKNVKKYLKTAKLGMDTGFTVFHCNGELEVCLSDETEIVCFRGKDSKTIMNRTKTSLGRETVFLQKLYLLENEEVLMLAQDDEESILAKFIQEETKKGKKALTIYSLEDNMSVQELVHMYQKKHPTVDVELQIGISDETITREDAIKRLNSSLISENGPDIILFDGLPYEKYIEQGLLEDIKPFVETQAEEKHLFSKMLDIYSVDGKQYGVPLFFSMMSMTSVNEIGDMNTMQDFMSQVEACAKDGEKSVFEKWSFDQIVAMLYRLYVADSVNGMEEADAKKIEEFYVAVKKLYEMEDMKEVEEAGKNFDNISLIPLPYNNCDAVIAGDVQMSLDYLVLMSDIEKVESIRKKQLPNKLLPEKDNLRCVPMMSMGVLNKSSDSEAAKEFLAFALSDKVQKELNYAGLYVNADAMEEKLAEFLSKDDTKKWLDDFENTSCVSEADWQLFRMIMEEVPKVAKGEQSEEAAAKEACRKMKLYLDE